MKFLLAGMAGFIGFHLAQILINEGNVIVGLDNINYYYDVSLKYARMKELGFESEQIMWYEQVVSTKYPSLNFICINLENKNELFQLFGKGTFDYVINHAAQAGVRYCIDNPEACKQSNIVFFLIFYSTPQS